MAAVDFKIYKVPAGKKATIFAVLRVSQAIRPELATGERVYPQHWGSGRVKGGPDKVEINLHLNQIEKDLLQVWRENPTADKATITELAKKVIRGENFQKKTVETPPSSPGEIEETNPVLIWMRQFIPLRWKKKSTRQVFNCTVDHLKGYANKNNVTITWELFNISFYDKFLEYLYSLGHNDNTVGKYVKKLKQLISEGFERDEHANINFKKKSFRAPSAEVDEIYLSESEIIQFYNVDVPDLLESKMRFVFACWVGLRFGDLTKINPNQVLQGMNGPVLKVVTEKTGEEVIIPLHPLAQEIWNYWQKNPPKKIDNPTFNEHIKTIAEKAGFDEPVQKRNTIKGKVSVQWVKKFEMVKAHTARRSFATNCYLMGMPSKTIMAVTGHRTEKAFLKYIRVTKDQHANIMADFFKRNSDTPIMRKAN